MKLAIARFRLDIPHPALGGESRSRALFRAPHLAPKDEEGFDMETVGQFVKLTSAGHSRFVNLNQLIWCEELVGQPGQQKQGGKK